MTRSHRDLGDARLWAASHHRSLDRRSRAQAPARRLPSATASLALAATATAVGIPAVGGVTVAAASSGVAAAQRALGITADGVMGPETRRAIKRFQRERGLRVTGRLDRDTRAALRGGGDERTSRRGDKERFTGAWVAELQRKLGVEDDGVFGPATRRAVREYQRENGLTPASGAPGPKTLAKLGVSRSGATTRSAPQPTDSGPAEEDPASAPAGEGVAKAVEAARGELGKPYQSGGNGPGGYDCSGLTVYAFKQAGISLGRSSFAQYEQGASVERSEIQAGDLVFFDSNGSGASHVGVATSATKMISATSGGVKENDFTSGYWGDHYVGARRVG